MTERRDSRKNSLPFFQYQKCVQMKPADQIPYYAPDGTSRGFRSLAAANLLIAANLVNPSYGRKGHLKAIWAPQPDGSNAVAADTPPGTRYSFVQTLQSGQCWTLRSLDLRDEDGTLVSTRGVFLQVVSDCLVPRQQPHAPVAGVAATEQ